MESKLLKMLYGGVTTTLDFCYENLTAPPLLSLLSIYDIDQLRQTAMSVALSADVNKKYQIIDTIMRNRNFRRLAGGTNRVVYRHLEFGHIVVKVAIDQEGIKNNPDEFINQRYIKPFCCKVFEVSPCGTVGVFERVDRITSRYEFASIADDVFDMIVNKLVGKYVLEDIGTKFMYNWGIRKGFGPVLLDFPYVFELDGSKIYCTTQLDNGAICGGEIDYDAGFNFLVCKKCGCTHSAKELSKPKKESSLFVQAKKKGAIKMKIAYKMGEETIKIVDEKDATQFMKQPREIKYQKPPVNADNIVAVPTAIPTRGYKKVSELRKEYKETQRVAEKKPDIGVKLGKFTGAYVSTYNEMSEDFGMVKAVRETTATVAPAPKEDENIPKPKYPAVPNVSKEDITPIVAEAPVFKPHYDLADIKENTVIDHENDTKSKDISASLLGVRDVKSSEEVPETELTSTKPVTIVNYVSPSSTADRGVKPSDVLTSTVNNTIKKMSDKIFNKEYIEANANNNLPDVEYNDGIDTHGETSSATPQDAISFDDNQYTPEIIGTAEPDDKSLSVMADTLSKFQDADSMETAEEFHPELADEEVQEEENDSKPVNIQLSRAAHRRSTRFDPEFYSSKGE